MGDQTATESSKNQKDTNEDSDVFEYSDGSGLDEDDDNDPMHLIERYVELKTRIWNKDHGDLANNKSGRCTGKKAQRLRSRLAFIERDLLFDKDQADNIWKPAELRLEAEESMRRKATRTAPSTSASPERAQQQHATGQNHVEPSDTVFGAVHEDSDVFGSMFTSTEERNDDQPHPLASNIRIVDFGASTGITPRQLLEQMCRNMDPGFRLKYGTLELTTYSARHILVLYWSQTRFPDTHAIQALPHEVILSLKPEEWTLEMRSIAATNVEQSQSYAAAVMVFIVASIHKQETQINLRLAGTWRQLLVSLSDARKEVIKSRDKLELKHLRRMIDKARDVFGDLSSTSAATTLKNDSTSQLPKHQRTLDFQTFSPEQARWEWASRTSSPTFKKMLEVRQQLPIHAHKCEILETIFSHPVSIISAETGSGKSTQCGSYILERELSSGRDCRILITQPRRISAITLARRVSQELGEGPNAIGTLRSLVGYSVRLESKTSAATRLTFATTGVLLRMLESSPILEQLDCLILDEVHERTLETDLLLIVLRELLKKRENLKIVLMSATVEARKFSDYFDGAPVLDIPGRTFPVEVGFLEDAIEATNDISENRMAASVGLDDGQEDDDAEHSMSNQTIDKVELVGYSSMTRKRLAKTDEYRIDYGLIMKLAIAIATEQAYAKYSSAILIFMPGLAEIRRLHRALLTNDTFSKGWHLHLLHSSFSTEELERAFSTPPSGQKKIVIATNIAETGITIPDVTAVIDTCKEKIMRFNERRQLSKLTEGFISRSSAKQRRGRAARVQDGVCFHLVTKHHHDNFLQEQSTPEILRLSLQDAILRLKLWKLGSAEETLDAAITPPPKKNIVRAVEKLREAGALTGLERLTALGEQVARLPLDVALAKLAILGTVFKCLDPVLAIISIMTSKNPFTSGVNGRRSFSRADSDLLSALNAYESWKRARSRGSSVQFCQKNFLSEQALVQIEELRVQLLVYLVDGGQVVLDRDERMQLSKARITSLYRRDMYEIPNRYNKQVGDDILLSLLSMSFFPRVLVREGKSWRNVYTNQQVSLVSESVNHAAARSVKWLCFSEAIQLRPGTLKVSEMSRIPEAALAVLLGQAEVKMFSGVISIDGGKIRLAIKDWKQALAIKMLRKALAAVLDRCYQRPGRQPSETDQQWLDLFVRMMTVKGTEIV